MAVIPLGVGDWGSVSQDISRHRLHNMYLMDNPASPDGISRISRPTLSPFATVGLGPIYGVFRQDDTISGDFLVVSYNQLYRVNSGGTALLVGSLPGLGFCQFAGTPDRVIIVRDDVAYSTDGTTITTIVMPDDVPGSIGVSAPVRSVACINNTFILTVTGTQRFYWINPGETDPDPLNFASAERLPDDILSVEILMDEIWFLGPEGPEVWGTTTDPDIPFQRINGRVYAEGCASEHTVVNTVANDLPCLVWVTATRAVVLAQGSVSKISTGSEEELLKTANNLRAWTFRHNRHDFYILTSDEFTLAYDLQRNEWSRWDSLGMNYWRAHLGAMSASTPYSGDGVTNALWMLTAGYGDDGDPVVREVSGLLNHNGKAIQCASLYVRVNAGWSPTYGFEPILEVRWSDDQGGTWSDYVQMSLGDKGVYTTDVVYRSLGLIVRPGREFQFRFTDMATFRLDYATVNEV